MMKRKFRVWLAKAKALHIEHKGGRPVHYWLHQTKHQVRRKK